MSNFFCPVYNVPIICVNSPWPWLWQWILIIMVYAQPVRTGTFLSIYLNTGQFPNKDVWKRILRTATQNIENKLPRIWMHQDSDCVKFNEVHHHYKTVHLLNNKIMFSSHADFTEHYQCVCQFFPGHNNSLCSKLYHYHIFTQCTQWVCNWLLVWMHILNELLADEQLLQVPLGRPLHLAITDNELTYKEKCWICWKCIVEYFSHGDQTEFLFYTSANCELSVNTCQYEMNANECRTVQPNDGFQPNLYSIYTHLFFYSWAFNVFGTSNLHSLDLSACDNWSRISRVHMMNEWPLFSLYIFPSSYTLCWSSSCKFPWDKTRFLFQGRYWKCELNGPLLFLQSKHIHSSDQWKTKD